MKTSTKLTVGNVYTREDLKKLFGIVDSTINTGIFRPKGHDSVWLFVTEKKTSDRTQYSDSFDGETLEMDGQTTGRTDSLIVEHKQRGLEILLFFRKEKYEHPGAGFRFCGEFLYVSHTPGKPSHFILEASGNASTLEETVKDDLRAINEENSFSEGGRKERLSSYYERNPGLRVEAIRIHGTVCAACGFNFEKVYGEHGKGYVEVHHLKPISSGAGKAHNVNPKTDMVVLCSNCHRMLHRGKRAMTLQVLRELF